jgi:hypothetical protein
MPPTLQEDDKLDAMGCTAITTRSADGKQTSGLDHQSNATSIVVNDEGKSEVLDHDDPATKEKPLDEPRETPTLAKGVEALFVMLALLLSITLVSLDQVSMASRLIIVRTHLRSDTRDLS